MQKSPFPKLNNTNLQRLAEVIRDPSALPGETDNSAWEELVTTARDHRMAGILVELVRLREVPIPQDAYQRLRLTAAADAGHVHAMKSDLARILAAFANAGVNVLVLKGCALHATIYPRPDLRPASDIDLLVAPEDVPKACRILEQSNCSPGQALLRPDFFPTFYYETEYHSNSMQGARIDLHAYPLRPLRYSRMIPHHEFASDATIVDVQGVPFAIPSPTNMLIHLAAHAAFHGFERLIWLHDIKCWVDSHANQIDPRKLEDTCRRWGLTLPVAEALKATAECCGGENLQTLIDQLKQSPIKWQDRLVLRDAPDAAAHAARHVLTTWLTTPGWLFRHRYLWAATVPCREHLGSIYPFRHVGWELAAFVYRTIRPIINVMTKRNAVSTG
ncbi:MAG: nucleotidyltransferase domain-containing protein [Phycisphaerae bacterium]